MKRMVAVGVITGAHGVRGEVKLRSFTADPATIASYNPLETGNGTKVEIAKLRPGADGFIATLQGIGDRDRAEALKATELFVPRERLPEARPGEIYLGDLIGLTVMNGKAKLGEVVAIQNYGAGDLLEVKVEGRRDTVLVPFTEGFVTAVDAPGGTIAVELPEGFLDEGE